MKSDVSKRFTVSLVFLAVVSALSSAQPRMDILINADWKFTRENPAGAEAVSFNDAYWENISLPHTWNARDGQDGGNDYYRGTGWYRKKLTIDSKYRGKNIYLRFEGAATVAQVFLNGAHVGTHKGNFGAFCFEVTSLVTIGKANIIAVKISNAKDTTIAPLRGDFTIFGGIYRGVRLLVLDKLSISPVDYASSGVYVKQVAVSQEAADLEVTAKLRNGNDRNKVGTVHWSILDQRGNVVHESETQCTLGSHCQGEAVQALALTRPHLWNGRKDPYLYQVVVELFDGKRLTDRVIQPLGLRFFRIDPEKGFFLNGQPYRLHGVNRHQDRENKGWAISLKDHQEDYRLIEEMGCTAVRLAHYQHAQEFYDLCDRGGMVVWAELALVDDINTSAEFVANCKEQLTELIQQNFNHPSILFWSLQNELDPGALDDAYGALVQKLNATAKQLDPTRLTAVASRSNYDGSFRINNTTDVVGYNVYYGWYQGMPDDFGPFLDKLHQNFPQLLLAVSEYGAGAGIHQHEWPAKKPIPRGAWHPEEWQTAFHEVTSKAIADRPYLWGSFVWNMFDFGVDVRSEGELLGRNDKGLVTYDRKTKKDAYYWYRANWNPEPMVHITSKRHSPRPLGTTEARVYSNCDSVELIANEVSLGTKPPQRRLAIWTNVELKVGNNKLKAVGWSSGKRVHDACTIVALPHTATPSPQPPRHRGK